MATALAHYQQPDMTMGEVERVANAIAKGGLFGSKDPYAILTLCLLAQAEGQHPAVVFRDYHIIQGKPAKKADAMLRDFLTSGGKIEWHTLDDDCADATFSHESGGTVRISWDKARVAQAQLGGNPMHKKYPRQMLRARVISEGVRTVFPGATSGLYVPEEVSLFDDDRAVIEAPANGAPPVEDEQPPRKPQKLDGPYTSPTALKAAYQALDREIRGCGDIDQFEGLMITEDTLALVKQLERDAPKWLHGSDALPAEFVPLMALIATTRTELTAAANDGWRDDVTRAG